MGAVSGLLGTAGGVNGSGIEGPQQANLLTTVGAGDLSNANDLSQAALTQQNQFLQAVQAQNGLGNQSNVYNQLQGVVNGTGPNPAQAQLAQATAANTANQAALMAGQRGVGQNTGLIARQAAMQGAANQQNSIGQGATLQAQQSLNALNSAGTLATNQANQQAAATSAATQAAQTQQNNLLNAAGSLNASTAGVQSNINSANAALISGNMNNQAALIGGAANGAAAAGKAEGGLITKYADGTPDAPIGESATPSAQPASDPNGPQSSFGKFFKGFSAGYNNVQNPQQNALKNGMSNLVQNAFTPAKGAKVVESNNNVPVAQPMPMPAQGPTEAPFAQGGQVKALLSPGEKYLPPSAVKAVEQGADPLKAGKKVPGKPVVGGAKNDYANDIVPASLQEGGIVLPRSVTQSKNPAKEAHKFVSEIMARQGKSLPKKSK